MTPLRIYADFNGLVRGVRNPVRTAVVLDTIGSLRDLCNAGVVLREGLPLIAVDWSDDSEDLEGHGTAQFDQQRGWWVVEFDERGVRYVPAGDRTTQTVLLCVSCRINLEAQVSPAGDSAILASGTMTTETCPTCGTRIDSPIAPPDSKAAERDVT